MCAQRKVDLAQNCLKVEQFRAWLRAGIGKTVPRWAKGDKESELRTETSQMMGQRVEVGRQDEGVQSQGQGSLARREAVGGVLAGAVRMEASKKGDSEVLNKQEEVNVP